MVMKTTSSIISPQFVPTFKILKKVIIGNFHDHKCTFSEVESCTLNFVKHFFVGFYSMLTARLY